MRTLRGRVISLLLAVEMVIRAVAYLLTEYGRETAFQVLTHWSPGFLLAGAILISAGSARTRPGNTEYLVAGAGHLLGMVFTANFAVTLVLGAVLQGAAWSSAGAFGFVAIFHGLRIYDCLRRVRWTRASSGA